MTGVSYITSKMEASRALRSRGLPLQGRVEACFSKHQESKGRRTRVKVSFQLQRINQQCFCTGTHGHVQAQHPQPTLTVFLGTYGLSGHNNPSRSDEKRKNGMCSPRSFLV